MNLQREESWRTGIMNGIKELSEQKERRHGNRKNTEHCQDDKLPQVNVSQQLPHPLS